ncbi:predicted protein [Nematostella vectensis]|uniref:Purple acid phosphatase n=2 Tax=Nematostella vectensis TaxID=45351 RepID=A7S4Y2_NEMVE|nr:predicted protein [Nematostella vectensis]|eukprot:XP_001633340.1 predicted protein [Nematostella vectensis]
MVITWVTLDLTPHSVVEYNKQGYPKFELRAIGTVTKFVNGGSLNRTEYIHRVTLKDLTPTQSYVYHCGGPDGWSEEFNFKARRDGVDWSPRLAIFGDLGNKNARSLPFLQEEVQKGDYDAIIHVGDFAYDLFTNNGTYGDEFMRQIQPIAALVPYMTCPGNHESAYNFSDYKNRFSMPGNTNGMYYSWNIGPVHFISISTEVYFSTYYGYDLIDYQYAWLERDLKEATSKENRTLRPWIFAMGHRPMYCSNLDRDDCTNHLSIVRTGIPEKNKPGLEDLFYEYGVDVLLWAHEHSYERLWPLYNKQMCNGTKGAYINPCAPVHIITGSAGCSEDHDKFKKDYGPWTAFRSEDYGYTRMTIHNKTHIYFDQFSVDKEKVIDSAWVIKDRHESYSKSSHSIQDL